MSRLNKIFFAAAIAFSASAFAATLEDAQKAYVSGNWTGAAEAFESVCPTLELSKRAECALWGVLARSQTGVSKDFALAKKRLDSLIFSTPDSLSVIADLYMTRAQFELYLKRADLAYKSLKSAFVRSQPKQRSVIHQVCQSLYKATPTDSVHSLCEEIQRAKSTEQGTGQTTTASPVQTDSAKAPEVSPESPSESVSSSSSPSSSSAAGAVSKDWTLQLGAFGIESNAEMLISSLKTANVDATAISTESDGKKLFRVFVGEFSTKEEALEYGNKVLLPLKLDFQPTKKQ